MSNFVPNPVSKAKAENVDGTFHLVQDVTWNGFPVWSRELPNKETMYWFMSKANGQVWCLNNNYKDTLIGCSVESYDSVCEGDCPYGEGQHWLVMGFDGSACQGGCDVSPGYTVTALDLTTPATTPTTPAAKTKTSCGCTGDLSFTVTQSSWDGEGCEGNPAFRTTTVYDDSNNECYQNMHCLCSNFLAYDQSIHPNAGFDTCYNVDTEAGWASSYVTCKDDFGAHPLWVGLIIGGVIFVLMAVSVVVVVVVVCKKKKGSKASSPLSEQEQT